MLELMQPAFIIHEVSGLHEVPPGHPERPDRHRAIMSAMGDDFLHWTHHQAPKASRDQLELLHSASYVEQMFEATANIVDLVPLDEIDHHLKKGDLRKVVKTFWVLLPFIRAGAVKSKWTKGW